MALETIDSGSNYNFGSKLEQPEYPRSAFDLSHLVTTTIPNAGIVYPLGLPIETNPNEDYDINVDYLLRVMPQVVPIYSRQRAYIYAFWQSYAHLSVDFQAFVRKGFNGTYVSNLPTLDKLLKSSELDKTVKPNSLANMMGLPIGANLGKLAPKVHSLWFMELLQIWRDYFLNKNYYMNDRVILPDDDSRFRLGKDGKVMSATDEGTDIQFVIADYPDVNNFGLKKQADGTYTFTIFAHDYPQDYFLSALPFPQRGDAPTLSFGVGAGDLPVYLRNNTSGDVTELNPYSMLIGNTYAGSSGATIRALGLSASGGGSSVPLNSDLRFLEGAGAGSAAVQSYTSYVTLSDQISLGITLNQIRELAIAQVELEKMARTDGSYGEFVYTFFGQNPRSAHDYKPVYIGGTYKNITFSEILQTAPAANENQTPLGSYAGHGITGEDNGYIGRFHSDDYGAIMFFICIMPDVYYSQGVDPTYTHLSQSEFYLPERAKLGLVPILNQELYFQGNEEQDADLWAYQNPYDYYRYRPNEILGKIADPSNLSWYPYTQARHFTSLPNWGEEFAEADDVRKDYLQSYVEDAYSAQFNFNIRAVRPLPYKPIPANIIN